MAARQRVPKTRAGGKWTESQFFSFIRSGLRGASRRWAPIYLTLRSARRPSQSKNKRLLWEFQCNMCKDWFPQKEVSVDHIKPIGGLSSFEDLPEFVERLFCEENGLQVLCKKKCHDGIKTKKDLESMRESRSIRVLYPREESTYRNMMSRCNNPKATGYEYYGGKGISVCSRWQDNFMNFYRDMGPRPEGTSLDRINFNGNYTPENCRWATPIEQARNTSLNTFLEFDGIVLCIEEWGERLAIKPNTITTRLVRGWPIGECLGLVKRTKPIYNGRLNLEDIEDMVEKINNGMTQSEYGRKIGLDSSQVNRLYHKFKGSGVKLC